MTRVAIKRPKTDSVAFPHLLIRASAGTGKTYQLTNRYLGLLAGGVSAEKVLATTFTRKAAGEIFDRVLHRLAEAATDRVAAEKLGQALQIPGMNQEQCRDLLTTTLANQHRLRIGTLDSYFAQLASAFALELGLPAGWRIAETQEDAELQAEAIERVLEREELPELLALLHLLAKGETQRGVSELIDATVKDLYPLFLQTNPSAWTKLAPNPPLTPAQLEATISEIQKLEMPAHKSIVKAWQEDILLASEGDWESFIAHGIGGRINTGAEKYYSWVFPEEVIRPYRALLDHARSLLIKRLAAQTEATYKLLDRFNTEFQHLKQERRLMRFDDVTLALSQMEEAGNNRLSFRLGGRLSHLLLDEFQDTSLQQWQVLRPLAQIITAAQTGSSFFCVGDVKQAIYGWRGGLAEIFGALEEELSGIQNENLAESRRSAQPIIDVVNQVFQNLTKHPNLERYEGSILAWQRAFPPHTTARKELAGHVTLATSPAAESDDDKADHHRPFVAERIAELARNSPGCSIGVLVRSNAMVAHLIYLLRKLDVPASEEGGNSLLDSPAVTLLMSLLQFADHPGDSTSLFHVGNSPLAEHVGLKWPCLPYEAAAAAQKLRRELIEQGYGPVVYRWAKWLAPNCDRRDLARLQQLVEMAFSFQPRSTLRTVDFINLVTAEKVADPQPTQIRVMTIHQSKGLQFDIVVLPEIESPISGQPDQFVTGRPGPSQPVNIVCRYANQALVELLPTEFQKLFDKTTQQKVDESLCVLYVALTRAIHAMHIILEPGKPNEKNPPKTSGGLLRAALAPDQPALGGKVLFEHGDPDWYRSWKKPVVEVAETPQTSSSAPIQLAAQSKLPRRLERVAPSQLEGGNSARLSSVFRESSAALRMGDLIHKWIELIEWEDAGLPDETLLRKIMQRTLQGSNDPSFDQNEAIQRFAAMLQKPALTQVFRREEYRRSLLAELPARPDLASCEFRVYRERTFALRDGERLLSGAIDRLVLQIAGGKIIGAQVIDFKTDDISQDGVFESRVETYRPQLAAYCAAVARLYELSSAAVSARLVFVNGDRSAFLSGG
ncbi:UvrD-helicase domain-containing protein [Anatilimnocola floriformis]|uniref:UvrD-helicase domain-containing protein n=1 Tax=Anatilimnocola floriformis TaxID=2948575 RepID=UPI0020C2F728|nr:UvrD-helicase domain-containing protein [Anatilimnocola floriformis]